MDLAFRLLDGDSKGLAAMYAADGDMLVLSTNNNDSLKIFKHHHKRKVIRLNATDRYADTCFSDGARSRTEFYFGAGYLSQSALRMTIPETATRVVICNY